MDPVEGTGPSASVSLLGRLRRLSRTRLVAAGAIGVILLGTAVVVVAVASPGGTRVAPTPIAASESPTARPPAPPVSLSAAASPSVSGAASVDPQQRRFAAAAASVTGKPGYLGIVVRDRLGGTVWRAGATERAIWTSSTIKLAMAASIFERGRSGEIRVDAAAQRQISAMFAVSDNDAADALWDRYGGAAMVPRFQQAYGMTGLTFVSGFPRRWGFLKSSTEDLQRLMSYVLEKLNATDRAYVVEAMRKVGAIQQWGVWAAGAMLQPGTKDGWSIETDDGAKHWCVSTVGFVGPGERYAVAVMYHLPVGSTIELGVHTVSDLVATVFGAPVPAPVTVPDASTGL